MLAASVSPYHRPEEKKFFAIRKEYKRIFGIQNSQQSAKKGISIIIAANNAVQYIEECLDSIKNQSYFVNNNNYQIIVCADGCEKTLQKLNSIKFKYQNLTITSTPKKLGTFVTLNNLLRSCSHNSIMHFHPEDIMTHKLVEEVMQYVDNFDIVKFDYQDFQGNISNKVNNKFWFNGGVCVYNKKVISLTGGFLPWVYAADIELIERVYNHVKIKKIEKVLYYKREMPGDMKLGTQKHPRKEFLQKIRRYSMNENVCISPAKVELPIEEVKDDEDEEITPTKEMLLTQKTNEEITPVKPGISILVTAYKSQNFIEECLDSIEKQNYFKDNNEFEVLLGIDACQETLNKVQEIRHKYRNLSVYMMKENKGTYVTTNTLIGLAKYENLLRFDSDDVMMKYMISEIMNVGNNYDYIRFKFKTFTTNVAINSHANNMFALGVVFYKKSIFDDILGGYRDWRCSGDYELFTRAQGRIKVLSLNKELFFRRNHPNNLSNKGDTALGSPLRMQYNKTIRQYAQHENVKIERIVNKYDEIDKKNDISNDVVNDAKKPISIIITAWQTQDYIEECLDSIENQTYFKDNSEYEVLVGVDACQETLNKLKRIRHKYRNLRIFMMDSNMGTYVTSNTLLDLVKYENILRFDSDDIMKPEMIESIIKKLADADIIRFGYSSFNKNTNDAYDSKFHFPHGVVLYKRKVFDISGGFQNWLCAADSELLERVKPYIIIKELNKRLFFRRQHNNSLTKREETKFGSVLRNSYASQIKYLNELKIKKVINEYTEY